MVAGRAATCRTEHLVAAKLRVFFSERRICVPVARGESRLDVVQLCRWCKAIKEPFVNFVAEFDRRVWTELSARRKDVLEPARCVKDFAKHRVFLWRQPAIAEPKRRRFVGTSTVEHASGDGISRLCEQWNGVDAKIFRDPLDHIEGRLGYVAGLNSPEHGRFDLGAPADLVPFTFKKLSLSLQLFTDRQLDLRPPVAGFRLRHKPWQPAMHSQRTDDRAGTLEIGRLYAF